VSDVRAYPQAVDGAPRRPGSWQLWKGQVWFTCPLCGTHGQLDHEVLADGTLDASVECPSDGCGFHEWIRLEGWPPA
jgi:hypothetical protein